ncbi:secreted protein containing Peptidase M23 domain protein [Candidatus Magnetomorum sp. HK-1]|nr:secreted protein containing Peptidase M23 domain protein [Candidatus Magnetomorum sp. HK-1]
MKIVSLYSFIGILLLILPANSFAGKKFGHPASTYQLTSCAYNVKTCASATKYHSGIDYSKNGNRDIVSTNDGKVVRIEHMSTNDHGMGNNVIVEHILEEGSKVYSLYAHLASIESNIQEGGIIDKGDKIGVMGGSGYGVSDKWGIHLHFELKDQPVTNNPTGSGLHWGYMPSNPDHYGYHDPNAFINIESVQSSDPTVGASCGSGLVYDCSLSCVSASTASSWTGDGYCDDGSYGMVLTCSAFNNDGGDCSNSGGSSSGTPGQSCGTGQVYDCNSNCVNSSTASSWTGDGYCDDGSYGMVLTCSAFNNDGGDCGSSGNSTGNSPGQSCGNNQVYDCNLNCVSASTAFAWTGDGYCDDGSYGMVLTCPAFNNDGGDCN